MKVVALALASLLGLSTVAFADEAPYVGPPGAMNDPGAMNEPGAELGQPADLRPRPRPRAVRGPGNGPVRAAIVAQFDRDGDGRLSPQERRHAARALRRMARQLARGERRQARLQRMQPQGRGPAGPGAPQVDVDVRW